MRPAVSSSTWRQLGAVSPNKLMGVGTTVCISRMSASDTPSLRIAIAYGSAGRAAIDHPESVTGFFRGQLEHGLMRSTERMKHPSVVLTR